MEITRILYQGKILALDPILAKLIGLNESIILKQIDYWCTVNEREDQNYHDGFYWVTSSIDKWQERDLIFWSTDTIKRIIRSLEKQELIISKVLGGGLNRVKSYRINHEKLFELEEDYLEEKTKKFKQDGIEEKEAKKEDEIEESKTETGSIPLGQNAPMQEGKMPQSLGQNAPMQEGKMPLSSYIKKINNIKINKDIPYGKKVCRQAEKNQDKRSKKIDLDEIKNYWNEKIKDTRLKGINKLTNERKRKLKKRLEEYSLEDIRGAIEKISTSDFCQGKGAKGWLATFDWLITNDTNIAKVLEGNYDNKPEDEAKSREDKELDDIFDKIGIRF